MEIIYAEHQANLFDVLHLGSISFHESDWSTRLHQSWWWENAKHIGSTAKTNQMPTDTHSPENSKV